MVIASGTGTACAPAVAQEGRVILEMDGVFFARGKAGYESGLDCLSFSVRESDFVIVRVDTKDWPLPLFDLAQGLVDPDSGAIRYMGKEWSEMSPVAQARMRTTIGRVFLPKCAWISNLSVLENTVLSARYHEVMSEIDLTARLRSVAQMAGLAAVSTQRPHLLGQRELLRSQWVRAFVLSPRLVLLEGPESASSEDDLPLLCGMVKHCNDLDGAVIWLTYNDHTWRDKGLKTTRRLEYVGGVIRDAD